MNKGAIYNYNKRTLTQIMGAKDEVAFYVTNVSAEAMVDLNNDHDGYVIKISGLIINDGDIDNMYNFNTLVYDGGRRWDGANAYGEEYEAFITEFVKESEFINQFIKL